jgi:hypothetical protein
MNAVFFTFAPETTMKLLNVILIFYVLVLIAIPCFDVPNDAPVTNSEIAPVSNHHNHDGSDFCSPFCACNCCVSPIVSPDYVIQINTFLPSRDFNSGYTTSYTSSLFASIWQPPKIS